jgi:hypothetical protein
MSDEWKITPLRNGYSMTCTTDARQPVLILSGAPEQMMIEVDGHTLSLYDWNLLWQRMITLIEAARINQRIGVNQAATEPDLNDTLCHACQRPPTQYQAWGMRCLQPGCPGTYYPRPFVEERFGSK